MFEHILLEPVQEELLKKIVEASRNTPLEKRQRFDVVPEKGRDSLAHPGIPKDKSQIYFSDVEVLAGAGLVALGYGARGDPNFDVTPLGFKYYEYLKRKSGQPTERIEKTVNNYISAQDFLKKYPEAYEKWLASEELLWRIDPQQQFTAIGHLCREAVQEFAESLVNRFHPPDVPDEKAKTKARLKAVINFKSKELGNTEKHFLEALIAYWQTVNDLIQRQEHGGQKEGRPLTWEDARRVVFQTLIVMYEIDRAL